MSKITLVTGLWDLGRGELTEGWSRPYETHYLTKFNELLKTENNLIIFGEFCVGKKDPLKYPIY